MEARSRQTEHRRLIFRCARRHRLSERDRFGSVRASEPEWSSMAGCRRYVRLRKTEARVGVRRGHFDNGRDQTGSGAVTVVPVDEPLSKKYPTALAEIPNHLGGRHASRRTGQIPYCDKFSKFRAVRPVRQENGCTKCGCLELHRPAFVCPKAFRSRPKQ